MSRDRAYNNLGGILMKSMQPQIPVLPNLPTSQLPSLLSPKHEKAGRFSCRPLVNVMSLRYLSVLHKVWQKELAFRKQDRFPSRKWSGRIRQVE